VSMTVLDFDRRDLATVWNLFKRNIRDRYLGSRLGTAWAVLNPLLMLSIFTYVFGFVFKVRFPGAETTLAYAIWLISGYGPWLAINESLMSAATSVSSASGLIKNLAFKSETLPVAAVLVGFVPLVISIAFVLLLLGVEGNTPTWHIGFVPLILVVQALVVIALGMFLAAANVFMRDLGVILPSILMMILFLSPIFYPLDSMPGVLRSVSAYNPFYLLADSYRAVLLHHQSPRMSDLAYLTAFGAVLGYFALRFFRGLKDSFDAAL
jgi:lipopolysaccharide transport system permease protein